VREAYRIVALETSQSHLPVKGHFSLSTNIFRYLSGHYFYFFFHEKKGADRPITDDGRLHQRVKKTGSPVKLNRSTVSWDNTEDLEGIMNNDVPEG
jgi:hypothetical protein